ncbi:MAG: GntR family transcriptional regulator [Thomasclavelia ramosa]
MQEFDVSRMTVRQAMNKLINEGYIERRRGKEDDCFRKGKQSKRLF